jgi:3-methyladenine DNA glycosylase/8-oxoguanine DNA glycosylase
MRVPPSAHAWRHVPSWEWHRAGVDPKRSRTICLAMRCASRLEQAVGMAPVDAAPAPVCRPGHRRLDGRRDRPARARRLRRPVVGDFHLSQAVGWALVGRPLDDDGMVELLEPWRPHRYRVVRLLELSPSPSRASARA